MRHQRRHQRDRGNRRSQRWRKPASSGFGSSRAVRATGPGAGRALAFLPPLGGGLWLASEFGRKPQVIPVGIPRSGQLCAQFPPFGESPIGGWLHRIKGISPRLDWPGLTNHKHGDYRERSTAGRKRKEKRPTGSSPGKFFKSKGSVSLSLAQHHLNQAKATCDSIQDN